MGLRDEVLSAQANYTCGIWAADCPVTPYLMRKRQPQQLFKTKCHRRISFAGSWPVRDCFSHRFSHLAQECGLLRRPVVSWADRGRGREDRRGGPCQVSILSPLAMDQLSDPTTWPFYSPNSPPRNRLGGAVSVLLGPGGETWACDYTGQKGGDPREAGRGGTLHIPTPLGCWVGRPARAKSTASRKSARRGQAPRTRTSSQRPIECDGRSGAQPSLPQQRLWAISEFSPPKRSHTEKQPGTSHLANSPSPPAKSKTYF